MEDVKYYTQEGLDALKRELNQLEAVERPKISQAIAEARDKGDLSENAEYDAAKEAQGLLELKIANLKNLKNNAEMTYTIVPESEADLKAGKISVSSPIAKALIGNGKGDVVTVQAPAGMMEFQILDISR